MYLWPQFERIMTVKRKYYLYLCANKTVEMLPLSSKCHFNVNSLFAASVIAFGSYMTFEAKKIFSNSRNEKLSK